MSPRVPWKASFALAALLAALLALPAAASADICLYQGSGNWSAPATWSCGHVPNGADDVTVGSGDNVVLDQNGSAATLTLESGGTLQLEARGRWPSPARPRSVRAPSPGPERWPRPAR